MCCSLIYCLKLFFYKTDRSSKVPLPAAFVDVPSSFSLANQSSSTSRASSSPCTGLVLTRFLCDAQLHDRSTMGLGTQPCILYSYTVAKRYRFNKRAYKETTCSHESWCKSTVSSRCPLLPIYLSVHHSSFASPILPQQLPGL